MIGHGDEVLTCSFVFTYFVDFDAPEWMLLDQVEDCEELSKFLSSQKWTTFFLGKDYLEFVDKYLKRIIVINK